MNSREMLAASIRLIVEEQLDAALASRGLASLTVKNSRDAWRANAALVVLTAVAKEFDLTAAEIRVAGRPQPAALARQVCVYLLRELAGFSRAQAVRAVGLTDPTTCYASVRRVTQLAATESEFADRLQALRTVLAERLQVE